MKTRNIRTYVNPNGTRTIALTDVYGRLVGWLEVAPDGSERRYDAEGK
jgi:hypothetical protein